VNKFVWTESLLLAKAKEFKTRTEFCRKASGAYEAAKRLDVFDKICTHMPKRKVIKSTWNITSVTKLIQQYEYIDDFRIKERKALKYIYRNKLNHLLDLIPSKKVKPSHWQDITNLKNEALKYTTRGEFCKNSAGAYSAATNLGVLGEVCTHMKFVNRPNNFWCKESILETALKYATKGEFIKNESGAYSAARRLDIVDEAYRHMTVVGSKYERAIYAFEFDDMSVYVGLTYNYDKRLKEHLNHNHTVGLKAKEHSYTYKKFNKWLPPAEAAKEEEKTLNQYRKNGWTILNKNKTGGLGAVSKVWDKQACKSAVDSCSSVSEFKEIYPSAYTIAHREHFWKEISVSLTKKVERNKWNKIKILEVAKTCQTRKKFMTKYGGAYNKARKEGWLEEACLHMKRNSKPANYWTIDTIKLEALMYDSRKEFSVKSKSAYGKACKLGIIDEVCVHMSANRPKWTFDLCLAEALKYKERSDFKNSSTTAYQAASSSGWLQDICAHMPKRKNQYDISKSCK